MLDDMFEAFKHSVRGPADGGASWDRGFAENATLFAPAGHLETRRKVNATEAPVSPDLATCCRNGASSRSSGHPALRSRSLSGASPDGPAGATASRSPANPQIPTRAPVSKGPLTDA